MRHYLRQRGLALAPEPGPQRMLEAPCAPLLVAPARLALQRLAGRARAPTGAVTLTPITVAANQNLHAATRAQEESGRLVAHEHPGKPRGAGRDRPRVQQSSHTRH